MLAGLPRDGRAENSVTGDRIAAGAIVVHRHCGVGWSRINAVKERQALHPVGIMNARADHDRLACGQGSADYA